MMKRAITDVRAEVQDFVRSLREREPITDVRAGVQDFVRLLRKTGEDSLKTKNLPEREKLECAVDKLGYSVNAVVDEIERSGLPEHARDHALLSLWDALYSAFVIGSCGSISENTEVYMRAVGTAPGRSKAAENREPIDKRMQAAIAEAEKIYPPDRRGNKKRIAQRVGVDPKTVSRHLKRKRTR